jgi:hypothetical protein
VYVQNGAGTQTVNLVATIMRRPTAADQEWPESAALFAMDAKAVSGGTVGMSYQAGQAFTHWASGFQGNGITREWYFPLKAGTYSFEVLGATYNGSPIVDWTLDGAALLTGQDWYSGGGVVANVRKANDVTVPTDGNHTLRLTINGRNAGNTTDYDLLITRLRFRKA